MEFQKSLVIYWFEKGYGAQTMYARSSARPNVEVPDYSMVTR
jgi:hypothetical protein